MSYNNSTAGRTNAPAKSKASEVEPGRCRWCGKRVGDGGLVCRRACGPDDGSQAWLFGAPVPIEAPEPQPQPKPVAAPKRKSAVLAIWLAIKASREAGTVIGYREQAVAQALADAMVWRGGRFETFASVETISDLAGGAGRNTVRRAIAALIQAGILTKQARSVRKGGVTHKTTDLLIFDPERLAECRNPNWVSTPPDQPECKNPNWVGSREPNMGSHIPLMDPSYNGREPGQSVTEEPSALVGSEGKDQQASADSLAHPTDSKHGAPVESTGDSATMKTDSSDSGRPPLVPGIPPPAPGDLAGDVVTPEAAREILGAEIDGFRTLAYLSQPEIAECLAECSREFGASAVREAFECYRTGEGRPGYWRRKGIGVVKWIREHLARDAAEHVGSNLAPSGSPLVVAMAEEWRAATGRDLSITRLRRRLASESSATELILAAWRDYIAQRRDEASTETFFDTVTHYMPEPRGAA